MKLTAVLLVLLVASGCTERTPDIDAAVSPPPPAKTPESPADILMEVDGAKLTRGQADLEIKRLLASYGNRLPPEQIESAKRRMLNGVGANFINQTLIRNETAKRNIKVSKEEEEEALEEIKAILPQAITLEQIMEEKGIGQEQMREMVRNKIKFDKLLDEYMTNATVVSEEEISDFCEKNKAGLVVPENVHARHILIKVDPDNDEKTKTEKRRKIEEIRKELIKGGDFAELARKNSDCPSRQMGGDLGKFSRDQMVRPFADAAFDQEVNVIGPLVETEHGYHIIQVLEHNKAVTMPRERIVDHVKRQKMQKAMNDLIGDLRQKAEIKDYRLRR